MNLYLRYFDRETLAYSVEEALDFLSAIPEIVVDAELEADIREYANSNVYYPKRYKVRPRIYFIIIKTEAATMLDFKQRKHSAPQRLSKAIIAKEPMPPSSSSPRNDRDGTKAHSTSKGWWSSPQPANTNTVIHDSWLNARHALPWNATNESSII